MNEQTMQEWKRICLAVGIGIPILMFLADVFSPLDFSKLHYTSAFLLAAFTAMLLPAPLWLILHYPALKKNGIRVTATIANVAVIRGAKGHRRYIAYFEFTRDGKRYTKEVDGSTLCRRPEIGRTADILFDRDHSQIYLVVPDALRRTIFQSIGWGFAVVFAIVGLVI